MVSPGADDARDDPLIGEVLQALIRFVEVGRSYLPVILLPRKARLVAAALIESAHVGIQPGHDLHDIEAFILAVGSESFEFLRPVQALAQAHPPGVAQPEERRAVEMLEMPTIGRDANRAVPVERIAACIWTNDKFPRDVM